MKGFLLGLIVALGAFAAYHYWKEFMHAPAAKPAATVDAGSPVKEGRDKKKRRRRGAVRVARNDPPGGQAPGAGAARPAPAPTIDEPEPIKLSSADLKLVSQGDDLSRPDVIHLGDATDDSGSHELTQDDIDARFRAKEEAILGCISRARPDEETYVPGRVTVKSSSARATCAASAWRRPRSCRRAASTAASREWSAASAFHLRTAARSCRTRSR
jgi:hypothetical protein